MIKIYMPWNNLGCLGLAIGRHVYLDIYTLSGKPAGVFCRVGFARYWWTLRSLSDGRVRRNWH